VSSSHPINVIRAKRVRVPDKLRHESRTEALPSLVINERNTSFSSGERYCKGSTPVLRTYKSATELVAERRSTNPCGHTQLLRRSDLDLLVYSSFRSSESSARKQRYEHGHSADSRRHSTCEPNMRIEAELPLFKMLQHHHLPCSQVFIISLTFSNVSKCSTVPSHTILDPHGNVI